MRVWVWACMDVWMNEGVSVCVCVDVYRVPYYFQFALYTFEITTVNFKWILIQICANIQQNVALLKLHSLLKLNTSFKKSTRATTMASNSHKRWTTTVLIARTHVHTYTQTHTLTLMYAHTGTYTHAHLDTGTHTDTDRLAQLKRVCVSLGSLLLLLLLLTCVCTYVVYIRSLTHLFSYVERENNNTDRVM